MNHASLYSIITKIPNLTVCFDSLYTVYVTRGYDTKYANNRQMKRTICKYVNKSDKNPAKVTYCPKSSNCVAVRAYKKSTSGSEWVLEEEQMGCQTNKYANLKRLCSQKACYMRSLPLIEDMGRLYRYCCCTGDGCNMFVLNDKGFENSKFFSFFFINLHGIMSIPFLVDTCQGSTLFPLERLGFKEQLLL